MRRALFALLLCAAPLTAQTAAPAPDSAKGPRRSPVYMVLALEMHGTRLITGEAGSAAETEPGMASIDFSIQSSKKAGVGLAFRSIAGEEAFDFAELAVLIGSRAFSFDIGAATRSGYNNFTDDLNDTTYTFARIGARSRVNLGSSDFSMTFRGAGYVKVPTPSEEALPSDLKGFSLETGLTWTWARYPLAASLGYRIEKFNVFGVEQEASSLVLGGGVLLGRR
jgi:hypothetical protein